VGSGLLLRDGDGVGVASSESEESDELEEPSRLPSTSSRPMVSEPWADGVDAAADNPVDPVAACEAGTPAVTASTTPSAAAAVPRRSPPWRLAFVVDTLDLKITMVIEPSRNPPGGKTNQKPGNTGK
jgi:hypothetical protein